MMGRDSVDHRSRESGRRVGRGCRLHTLALIAHDNKKVDLVAWATFNRAALSLFDLVATGHTAQLVHTKVGLPVQALLSGPQGGDAQIAAMVATAWSAACSSSWIRSAPSRMSPTSAPSCGCATSTTCRWPPISPLRT